jgi:hypothetical protein
MGRSARRKRAARSQRRQEERRELHRQQLSGEQWGEWVRTEIRAAVKSEHEFMIDVVGRALGEECKRVGESLELRIKTLEGEIAELRGLLHEKIGGVAEKSGGAFLALAQRLTECEKAALGMKMQVDTVEKMSTEAMALYRKFMGYEPGTA